MVNNMKNILVTITSVHPLKKKYIDIIIDTYSKFTNYTCKIYVSSPYGYINPLSTNIINAKVGPRHAWTLHDTINSNYQDYDYVINSDDDILITEANIDYYTKQSLAMNYIAGFLVYEEAKGFKQILSMPKLGQPPASKRLLIGENTYIIPTRKHSACFIVDKNRYKLYLDNGRGVEPSVEVIYGTQIGARTDIYDSGIFDKVIPITAIKNGSALVKHLAKHFTNELEFEPIKYWTPEFLN